MKHSNNLQDLITTVARDAKLREEQSAAAVSSVLQYLTARLPSPTVGKLHELLQTNPEHLSRELSNACCED